MATITTNEIKKGVRVALKNGMRGIMADNMRGNRRMVDVKGAGVGLFDEIGSVYAHDIVHTLDDGEDLYDARGGQLVEHTPAQVKLRAQVGSIFG